MQMVFTRMLSAANFVRERLGEVEAGPARHRGRQRARERRLAATVVMLTMRPPPRCFMCGIASRDIPDRPITFRSCHGLAPPADPQRNWRHADSMLRSGRFARVLGRAPHSPRMGDGS